MTSYIKSIQTLFRYFFSGGIAALVNIGIFSLLLYKVKMWYLLASILSFSLSFVVSFYLQKYWTFQNGSGKETKQQMFWYLVVTGVNLGVNVVMMALFVEVFSLNPILAKVLTLITLACWSFFIYKKFIFNKKPKYFSSEPSQ